MKHLNIFLVAVLFLAGIGISNAQDKDNPWAIELGVNAVDFFPIEKTDDGRFPAVTKGGIFTELIAKNTPLPAEVSQVFSTSDDNQPAVTIRVFQRSSANAISNEKLDEFESKLYAILNGE